MALILKGTCLGLQQGGPKPDGTRYDDELVILDGTHTTKLMLGREFAGTIPEYGSAVEVDVKVGASITRNQNARLWWIATQIREVATV